MRMKKICLLAMLAFGAGSAMASGLEGKTLALRKKLCDARTDSVCADWIETRRQSEGGSSGSLQIAVLSGNPAAMDIESGMPVADVVLSATNAGDADTGTLSVSLTGSHFQMVDDQCVGTVLAPTKSCTMTLRPVATEDGSYSGNLSVSASPGGTASRALSGTASGFSGGTPEAILSMAVQGGGSENLAMDIDADSEVCGGKGEKCSGYVTFVVTNSGTAGTGQLSSGIDGDGNFEYGEDTCAFSVLAPAQTCLMEIRAVANADGSYSGTLSIADDDGHEANIELAGTASGLSGSAAMLALQPDYYAFANGESAVFELRNCSGCGPAVYDAIDFGTGSFYSYDDSDCYGRTLGSDEACSITISYGPYFMDGASYDDMMTVHYDGYANSVSATLSGELPCEAAPGSVCADGTVYAGRMCDTYSCPYLYTTRCDAGMTWDEFSQSCTGVRDALAWGPAGDEKNAISEWDGRNNMPVLWDSVHEAAYLCANLGDGGYGDWYLPASEELRKLSESIDSASGTWFADSFDTSGTWPSGSYWSSSEDAADPANRAWGFDHASRDKILSFDKTATLSVRCFRYNID